MNDETTIPRVSDLDKSLFEPIQATEELLPFVEEFRKLQQALRKSHEGQSRFYGKSKELAKHIRQSKTKLQAYEASEREAMMIMRQLGDQIETCVEAQKATQKEILDGKAKIKEIKRQGVALDNRMQESAATLETEQKAKISKLENKIDAMTTERDNHITQLSKQRSDNIALHEQYQAAMEENKGIEREILDIEEHINKINTESGIEADKKRDLERQMKEMQQVVNDLTHQIQIKQDLITRAEQDLTAAENQLLKTEEKFQEHRQRCDEIIDSHHDHTETLMKLIRQNKEAEKRLNREREGLQDDIKSVTQCKKDVKRKRKELDLLRKKVKELQADIDQRDAEKQSWQGKIQTLKDRQEAHQAKLHAISKQRDTAVREREVLTKTYSAKVDSVSRKQHALHISKTALKNMKNEYHGYSDSIRRLSTIIDKLKREKAQHEKDLYRREAQKRQAEEEATERELRITELKREILQTEAKMKQQQTLSESVKNDKAHYRKVLAEQKGEMKEYKRKFSNLSVQIKHYKSEINEKDIKFVTEHLFYESVKADIEALQNTNGATTERMKEMDHTIAEQAQQISKLSLIITEADEELKIQTKQYNGVVNEQKVLNQQLIARNEELANLYEELKLQQSMMRKGAETFTDKQTLVQGLEDSRDELAQKLQLVAADEGDFTKLGETIAEVEDKLTREKMRVRALQDELSKTMNVHRWRQLKDTDSETYGMIRRVHKLQKSLIQKSSEVEKKDKMIQDTEKLYVDLRRVLARQPGSEAAEQVEVYEQTLKDKRSKLRTLKSELAMYQSKVEEYEFDLEKLRNDLRLIKLEYFERRRNDMQEQRRQDRDQRMQELMVAAGRYEDDEPVEGDHEDESAGIRLHEAGSRPQTPGSARAFKLQPLPHPPRTPTTPNKKKRTYSPNPQKPVLMPIDMRALSGRSVRTPNEAGASRPGSRGPDNSGDTA